MTNDEILAGLRLQQARRKRGGCSGVIYVALALAMIAAFAILTADRLGYVPPSVMGPYVGTPQTTFSTRQETPGGLTRPPIAPLPLPGGGGAPAWPTLTPGEERPTATVLPSPTTDPAIDAHLTAVAIQVAPTETAQAVEWKAIEGPYFYDPYTLATPEVGFGGYVDEQCQDKERVGKSLLLQQMCTGE